MIPGWKESGVWSAINNRCKYHCEACALKETTAKAMEEVDFKPLTPRQ